MVSTQLRHLRIKRYRTKVSKSTFFTHSWKWIYIYVKVSPSVIFVANGHANFVLIFSACLWFDFPSLLCKFRGTKEVQMFAVYKRSIFEANWIRKSYPKVNDIYSLITKPPTHFIIHSLRSDRRISYRWLRGWWCRSSHIVDPEKH